MKQRIFMILISFFLTLGSVAADPFTVHAQLQRTKSGSVLEVRFTIEAGNYIYAESVKVTAPAEDIKLKPKRIPEPVTKDDKFSGKQEKFYTKNVVFTYIVSGAEEKPVTVTVDYQGCGPTQCFLPQSEKFTVTADSPDTESKDESPAPESVQAVSDTNWRAIASEFTETGRATGYLDSDDFTAFIEKTEAGKSAAESPLIDMEEKGVVLTLLLILLGGLALNLTPCVLPLIPVNLAIIGAGTQARSKKQGFASGAIYGMGIAIAYGTLGLFVVLTGATFGALNASPIFNIGIAVLFVILALATFDVFSIDLSNLGGNIKNHLSQKGGAAAVFLMGVISAALAGACVAPIVISVLVLSGSLYSGGNPLGLVLPFVLGAGMALPWPFAGAGLTVLPKPGNWMKTVKYIFGVFILALAAYYGYTGYTLLSPQPTVSEKTATIDDSGGWERSLAAGLIRAEKENKPVIIDFWATWCKSCMKMNRTTLKDAKVREKLAAYVKIKFQAEDPNAPEIKKVLDYFTVAGLPTFIIMKPRSTDSGGAEPMK